MKKILLIGLVLALVAAYVGPAFAVPRLQTYIVDSKYHYMYKSQDYGSWISNKSQFDLKVVGYWGSEGNSGSGYLDRPILRQPAYDFMDCYLAMRVPTGQSGTIYINGVEITTFERYFSAVPDGTSPAWTLPLSGPAPLFGSRYNFSEIGRIDNDQVNAWHYGHGSITSPGWGDEIMLNVVIRGFEWAHFDAIGVDSQGRTWTNEQWHDSSYYATPEPSTLGLLGIGLLGIAPLLRRRKH
ncbi:MAG: choice-of-anchor N protein [Candidatus Krumholzibacteria bacterium]|nr:choice-of-anchor N protein [Candidatus Krumholzibacteria bacterium]